MFRNGVAPMLPTRCVRAGEYRTSASTGSMLMISFAPRRLPAQRRRTDGNPEVGVLVNVIQRAAERLDGHVQHPRVFVVELDEMMGLADGGHLHFGRRRALCAITSGAVSDGDAQARPRKFSSWVGIIL